MNQGPWFWEYIIKIDTEDGTEQKSGLVVGDTFSDASNWLEEYYGSDLIEINMLKAIHDTVFEFQSANLDSYFDFYISKR